MTDFSLIRPSNLSAVTDALWEHGFEDEAKYLKEKFESGLKSMGVSFGDSIHSGELHPAHGVAEAVRNMRRMEQLSEEEKMLLQFESIYQRTQARKAKPLRYDIDTLQVTNTKEELVEMVRDAYGALEMIALSAMGYAQRKKLSDGGDRSAEIVNPDDWDD